MKAIRKALIVGAFAGAWLVAAGCGGVSGNTYQAAGGAVSIEFQSGGKATLTFGGMKQACTYVEDNKTVTLTCEGDKTVFTLQGNQLIPPSTSLIGPLTKK